VSTKSAYQWRRWRAGGIAALASKGPGGAVCRLSQAQLSRLRAALDSGPAAWGLEEDQWWTLERVTTLIGRLFHARYTLRGTSYLLHRMGFTPLAGRCCPAGSGRPLGVTWRSANVGFGPSVSGVGHTIGQRVSDAGTGPGQPGARLLPAMAVRGPSDREWAHGLE
jgi:transposase